MNYLIEALKPFPYWVCRGSDKRPCVARWYQSGEKPVGASPSAPKKSGRSYGVAAKVAAKVGAFNGIGFILEKSLGIVCIDLDHCIDDQGNVTPFAAGILKTIDHSGGTYVEYSPSHTGLHIWGYGELPSGKESGIRAKRKAEGVDIELYQDKRYMTVTGEPYDGRNVPLGHMQEAIDGIIKEYGLEAKAKPAAASAGASSKISTSAALQQEMNTRESPPPKYDDDFLIDVGRRMQGESGDKFRRWFDDGDFSSAPSHSEADGGLCGQLAFLTNGNEEQMKRLFLRSALARGIEKRKKDVEYYVTITVEKAIALWQAGKHEHYEGKRAKSIVVLPAPPNFLVSVIGQKVVEVLEIGGGKVKFAELLEDTSLARMTLEKCGGCFSYCVDLKKWLEYDGIIWKEVEREQLFKYVEQVLQEIKAVLAQWLGAIPNGDSAKVNMLISCVNMVTKVCTNARLSGILAVAKGLTICKSTDFDNDPGYVNCLNCYLEIATNKQFPHLPTHMCMKCTGVNYTESFHSSLVTDKLQEIMPDQATREHMELFFGAILLGMTNDEKFAIFHGRGGNGKGVIMAMLAGALGSYAKVDAKPGALLSDKHNSNEVGDKPDPTLSNLVGIRLLGLTETSQASQWSLGTIKRWTGSPNLNARAVYGKAVTTFPRRCNFIVDTNHIPKLDGEPDDGTIRRFLLYKFSQHFDGKKGNLDTNLKAVLASQDNREDMLLTMVLAARRYLKAKETDTALLDKISPMMEIDASRYYRENDNIRRFVEDYCELEEGLREEPTNLWNAFCAMCNDYELATGKKGHFYEKLKEKYELREKKSGVRYLIGIKLNPDKQNNKEFGQKGENPPSNKLF